MQIQKRSLINRGTALGLLYLKPLSKPNQWNHGFFPFNPSFSGGNSSPGPLRSTGRSSFN